MSVAVPVPFANPDVSIAKSGVKALYLQAAALAAFEVSPASPEVLVDLVDQGFVLADKRGRAVASLLKLIAVTLEIAEDRGDRMLHEGNVHDAKQQVCPIYPFGERS
jgi:hypothetical protein